MPANAAHRNLAVVAVAVAAALTAAHGTAGASSIPGGADDGPVFTLLDAGDPANTVDVGAATPSVGDAAVRTTVATATGTMELTGSAELSVVVDQVTEYVESLEVLEFADDGAYTTQRRVESYDYTDRGTPAVGGFASDEELETLVGLDLTYVYGTERRLVTIDADPAVVLTAEQQTAIDELIATDSPEPLASIDTALGEGARVVIEMSSPAGDATIPVELTVTAIDDESFTVEAGFAGDVAELYGEPPEGFDTVSGEYTATITGTRAIDDPLVATSTMTVEMYVELSGPDNHAVIDVILVEEQASVRTGSAR